MKLRALLLDSAAVLVAASAATAADLPLVEPVEFVRICDAFGTGFFYIPGTDTCLKIGGTVLAEAHYVDGDVGLLLGDGTPEQSDAEFNNWTSRARGNVQFETRTSTEIGLIRTYIEMEMTIGPADFGADYSGGEFALPGAFIEVSTDHGVFTAGHTGSFFDFYGSDDYGTRIDVDDSTTEQHLFAYTLVGPQGLAATLSVEDPDSSGRRLGGAGDDYEGQELPDLVGNIRLDRDWGAAQVTGVVRHIHDNDGFVDDSDGIGWAASAGASLTLPIADIGFSTQVGYADGAIAYITNDPGGVGDFSGPDGDDTNQAWMVRAGITVPLTETVGAWLDGSFTHAEEGNGGEEYDFWAVVVGAAWSPNDALSMGPEFGYNNLDGDDPGEDGDVWGVMWHIESSF